MMYGQMTAGSWIYIGSQGIVQGTYETFVEMGRQHYGGSLAGRWILTAGLGGMGGAQPLAATMAGASCLAIECQPSPHRDAARAPATSTCRRATSTTRSRIIERELRRTSSPLSVALLGNAAEILPELVRRGVRPDLRDRPDLGARSGQRLPAGRLDASPNGRPRASAIRRPSRGPPRPPWPTHVRAMLDFWKAGVPTVDYGNNIRQMALEEGVADAFSFPGFVPAYIRPLFCRGIGPFRWAALSGDPEDIYRDRREGEGADAGRAASPPLARHGAGAHPLPGPAGPHLLGRARRPAPARARLQRDGAQRRGQGADRHRARPPRFGLRRLAEPRDGGDAGRLGRRVRLAAAQRAPQLRVRRHLGVAAPWRRRRHGHSASIPAW